MNDAFPEMPGLHEPSSAHGSQSPNIKILLVGLQSPINIGMILRVAETYRVPVALYRCEEVLDDGAAMLTVSDFACGALQRCGFSHLREAAEFHAWIGDTRLVATSIESHPIELPKFRFDKGDIVAFGSEYDGLDQEILSLSSIAVKIPMAEVWTPKPRSHSPIDPQRASPPTNNGQPNLNVAISAGIICYAAYVRAREPQDADQTY
jgi:tRNA G18 (ribose-2'-O)-methylase SpoU